jgi:hypothetical protein
VRAIVAKRLRRQIYGAEGSIRVRQHFFADRFQAKLMPRCLHGCCVADQKRRDYQHLKRLYIRGA